METDQPKRRLGFKFVCELRGKEFTHLAVLTDGRIICLQADAPPILINTDGTAEELSVTEKGAVVLPVDTSEMTITLDVAKPPASAVP